MGFNDKAAADSNESRPNVVFSVTEAEMAYWHAVKFANAGVARQIQAGQTPDMSPDMQAWFIENADQSVNPEPFGLMWYLDVEYGDAKLVDRGMLEMTGMDKPENQPGAQTWAIGPPAEPSGEPGARKARSMAALEQRQVPTIDHLPFLEDSTTARLRTVEEIANRAVCLMAVSIKAEVYNEGDVVEWHPVLLNIIETFQIGDVLSPAERSFADDMAPEQQTAVQFIWRYEALTVLLWALGFVDELTYPSGICDVPQIVGVIKEQGPEGLKANARLRPVNEILDQVDFIYRLHWAVRQARVSQSAPVPNTEPGVVMERHHALNWLLASRNEPWDEVATDT